MVPVSGIVPILEIVNRITKNVKAAHHGGPRTITVGPEPTVVDVIDGITGYRQVGVAFPGAIGIANSPLQIVNSVVSDSEITGAPDVNPIGILAAAVRWGCVDI
jgi:hypothetical protein